MLHKIFRYPWIIIGLILAGTLFFSLQLPRTSIDNDITKFIPKEYPSRRAFDRVEETFGSQDHVSIAFHALDGTIFTTEAIVYLNSITEKIQELPYVLEVNSLTNSDYIRGTEEGMEVVPLVDGSEGRAAEIEELQQRLLSWDAYRRLLFSDDFRSAQVIATLQRDLDVEVWEKAYYDIRDIVKDSRARGLRSHVAGNPVMTALMGTSVRNDLRNLIPFVLVVVFIFLYLSFRNIGGVLLPIITVSISTIWIVGLMALLGVALSMIATAIPVLLIAVGSAYGIHIVNHYYDNMSGVSNSNENRRVVFDTLVKVGKPVLLAGLTTIAGFGSLSVSSVLPMRHFGIFTAIGVAFALIVALSFIPALLLVRRRGFEKLASHSKRKQSSGFLHSILRLYGFIVTKRSLGVILSLAIIMPISVYGMSKIVIDNSMVEYFRKGAEIRDADDFLRGNFGGTKDFSVVVRGQDRGDLTDPEILKAMDDLTAHLKNSYAQVGKVISFTDYIKRMNRVMNYTEPEIEGDVSDDGGFEGSFFTEEFASELGADFEITAEGSSVSGGNGADKSMHDPGGGKLSGSELAGWERDAAFTRSEIASLMREVYLNAGNMNLTAESFIGLYLEKYNIEGGAYNEIPYDADKYPVSSREELQNLITQYLLLFSGNLDDFADDALEPAQARIHVMLTTTGNHFTKELKRDIMAFVEERFPEGYEVEVAGHADIEATFTDLIVRSQILSIVVALAIVFIIISVSFRSMAAGLYGIIPLSLAIIIIFGVMGYAGFLLDIVTSLVASVAIGIGIDYSIHFLARYYHERRESGDLDGVTTRTLYSTGKAIIINAITVCAGFAVLMFSNFIPIATAGLLVALTMITTSLAAMTVLPVLLNRLKPGFLTKDL
jgi:predicted RND superfamily exporter protein